MDKKITYKEAVKELEEILSSIESEEIEIDILSEKVKRAAILIKFCKEKLTKTEAEVNYILEEMDKQTNNKA